MADNGTILHGTYQFAFRLIKFARINTSDSYVEKRSKFSLATNPMSVFDKNTDGTFSGAIGRISNTLIDLSFTVSQDERHFYTHYQIAVLWRGDGLYVPPTQGYLLPPVELNVNSNVQFFRFTGMDDSIDIPLEEIFLDDAPIESVRDMVFVRNRNIGLNIKYHNRTYSDYTYDKQATTVIKRVVGGYSNQNDIRFIGHFRDELYRYAISYFDEYGNFSPPSVIDFTGVDTNESTSKDFRYPKRSSSEFALFDENGSINAIGLRIAGINNHPTWAKGFVILRARRRKNILYQTPLINTTLAQPQRLSVADNYPPDGTVLADYDGSLVTKSFYYPLNRQMRPVGSSSAVTFGNNKEGASMYVGITLPAEEMYNIAGNTVSLIDERVVKNWKLVDAAILRQFSRNFGEVSPAPGFDNPKTLYTATFSAPNANHYYYKQGHVKDLLEDLGVPYVGRIIEHGRINTSDSSYVIRSSVDGLETPYFGNYTALFDSRTLENLQGIPSSSPGGTVDIPPVNQRSAIIVSETKFKDLSYDSMASSGTIGSIEFTNDIQFDAGQIPVSSIEVSGSPSISKMTLNADGLAVVVPILNIEAGLSDERYGGDKDYNEYLFTGTIVSFTNGELDIVKAGGSLPKTVDVWGGDCFITRHMFKLMDTQLAIADVMPTDSVNNLNGIRAWEGGSQIIQIFLESQINADIARRFTATRRSSSNANVFVEGGSHEINIPFNYEYMGNFSLENAVRVFVPNPELFKDVNKFPVRIAFSNVKVWGTDIEGVDEFPSNNFYDLEGVYGEIEKVEMPSTALAVFQEFGVAMVPLNARTINTRDGETISIQSEIFISDHEYISRTTGCKFPRSIKNCNGTIYFFDSVTKRVYELNSQGMSVSSSGILKPLKDSNEIDSGNYESFYDSNNNKYAIRVGDRNFLFYSQLNGLWNHRIETEEGTTIRDFVSLNDKDGYFIWSDDEEGTLNIDKAYVNSDSVWFGKEVIPFVKFAIVPRNPNSSVYDNMEIYSSKHLLSYRIESYKEDNLGNMDTGDIPLEIDQRRGLYYVKTMRNILPFSPYSERSTNNQRDIEPRVNQRLEGKFSVCTIKFSPNNDCELTSIKTITRNRK